ncbi:TPA_exp: putative C6 transcription factor [Trichophyton benhamiae CBS 112371]|uniref:C6 finger domain transcription factor nscR n=2 Tax=Trichophyton TaxID=5550 RepID=D4AP33_ARTBC|nr:C6 transcription factor, putative [Trichophyton benhamiae CBS 112371]XP_003019624.1 C6 transcription factor, putative [Trichophyton verrucosum HKI 0517]EFE35044.1 C6 transcription factor, putative [Trichophyton benhamiae CBS 112371]EFE38979.1 C6 transcription factor, putative [Trichophyton verrucosum HKI 0517]DAA77947.1 TPA_exp: putative C6 transcription factor [Trichophyton benhamiae CBS 112371]
MSSTVAADPAPPTLKPYACVLCQQRKVRCDRQSPCSGCRKYEVNCIYRPPPAPKRRKRRSPEETLLARLRKYEELLVGLGVDVSNIDEHKSDSQHAAPEAPGLTYNSGSGSKTDPDGDQEEDLKNQFGRMIIRDGKTHLLENSLWVNLSSEIGDPDTILDVAGDNANSNGDPFLSLEDSPLSDGGEFIIAGSTGGSGSLRALHPDTVQIFKLWQIYIDNMDPVTKLCHKPTVQQQILDATSDLDNIPKDVEALMFGIYTCAVASLREDDCISRLGETREALLSRFHLGAKRALVRADFLTSSDLTVYRAFLLYLLSLREFVDAQTLWVYSGVAMRIAQRLGLHRDGARFGLPIFEVEMRRRLWWPTVYFDGLCGELCGMGASLAAGSSWDTKLPLNVNDSEITPGMRDLPIEHKGITEMSFCLVRYEVGLLLRDLASRNTFDGAWGAVTDKSITLSDRLKRIDALEALLQDKYMQYCDTSISFHLLTWVVGYSCIVMLRFRARSFSRDAQNSQEVRDALFADTLQIIANYHTFRLTPGIQRYYWHVTANFQWHAFIHLLNELQTRTEGEQVDRAWEEVGNVYTSKPELLSEAKNPLYIAIGNLTLKAWDARKVSLARASGGLSQDTIVPPCFIEPLRARRMASAPPSSASSPQGATTSGQNIAQTYPPAGGQNQVSATPPLFPPTNMAVPTYEMTNGYGLMPNMPSSSAVPSYELPDNPVDWSQWETLLQGSAADMNFEM